MIIVTSAVAAAPYTIAGVVGLVGMLVGFYLIFVCENRDKTLLLFGLFTALLGTCVYSTVRFPDWLPTFLSRSILISVTLLLVLLGMLYLTVVVWHSYHLKPPHVRIKELVAEYCNRIQ